MKCEGKGANLKSGTDISLFHANPSPSYNEIIEKHANMRSIKLQYECYQTGKANVIFSMTTCTISSLLQKQMRATQPHLLRSSYTPSCLMLLNINECPVYFSPVSHVLISFNHLFYFIPLVTFVCFDALKLGSSLFKHGLAHSTHINKLQDCRFTI